MPVINWILRQDQFYPVWWWGLSVLRSGAPAAPRASRWSHSWCWIRRHKLVATTSLLLVFLLTLLLFLPLCQSSIGNALFLCWGWNNEVDVFDVNAATWTKPETLVRCLCLPLLPPHVSSVKTPQADNSGTVLIELSLPGSASEAQKPPRQCRVGEQRLHLWRGGECV